MRCRVVVLAVLCLLGVVPAVEAGAATPTPEPFGSWTAMVDRTYLDLTSIAPTTAQRNAAVAALSAGTKTQADLVADLRESADHTGSVDPVTRLYRAFLLRVPDKGGLEFWIKRRRTGTWTLNRIADSFATSSEFKTRYGSLSNLDFVKLIYDNVLERPYDASGLGFWTRQLDGKRKTRGAVMANFSESNEYKRKQAAEVTVSVLTIMLLGRAPNATEFATGVAAIEGGQSSAGYAEGLLSSAAYATRVGAAIVIADPSLPPLYTGVPFQAVLTSTGSGDKSWSAPSLPPWLTLDMDTGALAGTPPAVGTTTIRVAVTAPGGKTGARTIALEVKAGMPAGCETTDCAQLSTAAGTVQVPAAAVTSVTRNGTGKATAIALTAAAPNIATGNILVIAPGANTPSGLIVKATSITGANGAARTVAVTPSTLSDAYSNGIIKATGTPVAVDEPPARTNATGCSGEAAIDIVPTATVNLKPRITLLWGKNLAGFGNVYVGTGGIHMFHFNLSGDLTYRIKGSMTGSVDCKLDVPGVTIPISVGPAGFLFFKLQPELGLKATAGIEIDTTVTVSCDLSFAYWKGQPLDRSTPPCTPKYTAPKISTADTGADLTISGGVTTSLTFNEAVGISGNLTASIHAGYKPLQNPIGVLDGRVDANITACLACAFGDDAPTFTLFDKTIWEKTFATWTTPSPSPGFPLAITTTALPDAMAGQPYTAAVTARGGTKPYTWSAEGLPLGLSISATTGAITGTPVATGTNSVTIKVTTANAATVSKTMTLRVDANSLGTPQRLPLPEAERVSISPDGRSMAIEPTDSPSVRTLDLATGVTATHGSAASPWTLPIARDGGTILAYRNDGIVAIQPGNDPTLVVAHTDLLNWPLGVDRTGRRIFYARGKDSSGPSDFRLLDRQAGTDISIAQETYGPPDARLVAAGENVISPFVSDQGAIVYPLLEGKGYSAPNSTDPIEWRYRIFLRSSAGSLRTLYDGNCTAPRTNPTGCPLPLVTSSATSPSGRYLAWSSSGAGTWMGLPRVEGTVGSQAAVAV